MGTIFVNSGNKKTSDLYRLFFNFSDKINLMNSDKYVALSNLRIYYSWKNIKLSYKNNKFKIYGQREMKNLSFLMDHILYQILKIILSIS